MSWMRKPWMKWGMPIGALVLTAALVTGGLALTGGAAVSEDDDWDVDFADVNPAFESVVVMPGEAVPLVLYSIEIDPESAAIAIGSGDIATVVVENLIEEPIPNVGPMTGNGDLFGNVTVTADLYNVLEPYGCIVTYPAATGPLTVITFEGITVHPGRTVTLVAPIVPGATAPSGAVFLLKAEADLVLQ